MRTALLGCLFLVPAVVLSAAGTPEIYGTLIAGSQGVRQVTVRLVCGQSRPIQTRTDNYGSYRLRPHQGGHCRLTVDAAGCSRPPALNVHAYDKPVRYDLVLLNRNGVCSLERR